MTLVFDPDHLGETNVTLYSVVRAQWCEVLGLNRCR